METQEKQSGFKQACVSSKSSGKYSDIDLRQNFKDFSHLTVQSSSDASKSNRVNADFDDRLLSKDCPSSSRQSKNTLISLKSTDLLKSFNDDNSAEDEPLKSRQYINSSQISQAENQEINKFMRLDDERDDGSISSKESERSGVDSIGQQTSDFDFDEYNVFDPGDDELSENLGSSGNETSDFEFGNHELDVNEQPITKPKDILFNESNVEDFLSKLETSAKSLQHSSAFEILKQYEELEKKLPNSIKLPPIVDTLSLPCCLELCGSKFTLDFVRRVRLQLPTYSIDRIYYFQFICIKNCTSINGTFSPKINETPICEEFFQRVYAIPKHRFDRFTAQLSEGLNEPLPHGNKDKTFEHASTSLRVAQIINQVDKMAEENPSDSSYLMPRGTGKNDVIKLANLKTKVKINPTQEFHRIPRTFRFQKANSHTMCTTCTELKNAAIDPKKSVQVQNAAKLLLKSHYINITNDRRDANIRKLISLKEVNYLLSLGHDGMSKHLSKYPHLLNFNTKSLTDGLRMMCSLNLALVHRKSLETPYQLHCFWNIDQMFGTGTNSIISQLLFTLSHCNPIPPNIAFQLDNCASNKCYTLLGTLGLLLLWIPELTNVYLCTSEVGHTHNDVDQKFGVLATALKKIQVCTPQEYHRFAEERLKGLSTNNLFPTTYDFDLFIHKNVKKSGLVKANHFFEITKQEDDTVTIKIARFLRSEKYLTKSSEEQENLFEMPPNLDVYPEIIQPKEFNYQKHDALCKAVNGAIPSQNYDELHNLPEFIKENYKPEPFEDLLKRIREKVVSVDIDVTVPEDPDNERIDAFLKRIKRPWEPTKTTSSSSSAQTVNSTQQPEKAATARGRSKLTEDQIAPSTSTSVSGRRVLKVIKTTNSTSTASKRGRKK